MNLDPLAPASTSWNAPPDPKGRALPPTRSLPPTAAPPVVELRQYLLHPGRRDDLVELFDRELVETQELTGMTVIGQFRDVDRPDHFVWLRGFHGMDHRRRSLAAFYGGPHWARHRDAANATMIDSDDVLLLRPVGPDGGLDLPAVRMRDQQTGADGGFVLAIILPRGDGGRGQVADRFAADVLPPLHSAGARTLGRYETEPRPNDFPQLPVRDEDVLVWLGAVESMAAAADVCQTARTWSRVVDGPDQSSLVVLRLAPTARSLLTGHGAEIAADLAPSRKPS